VTTPRERWNSIRKPKPEPTPQPAEPPAGPSSVVVGRSPDWEKTLEAWGMVPAFGEDDSWTKRIRGY